MAIDPGKGMLRSSSTKSHLEIQLTDLKSEVNWIEVALQLRGGDWLKCGQIYVKLKASSVAPIVVTPCLRALGPNGFKDHFVGNKWTLTPVTSAHGICFDIPEAWIADNDRFDLHFFLEAIETRINFKELAVTGIHSHLLA